MGTHPIFESDFDCLTDMDFDSNCYRESLISFSVIHFLSVSSLLGLIIFKGTVFDPYYNNDLLPSQYPIIIYTLALGSILAVIASFVGWFASGLSRVRGSVIYIIILSISLALTMFSSSHALTLTMRVDFDGLDQKLTDMIKLKYGDDAPTNQVIDSLQIDHSCCGISSHTDWEETEWYKSSNALIKIPESCCQRPETGCNRSNHPSNIWAIEGEKPLGCVRPLVQLHT